MNTLCESIISIVANIFAIGASSIALYLFFFQRDTISSAFRILLNYSQQLSLSDLKAKLDRLNDHNASVDKQKAEVINILHEIEGQIIGSKSLKIELSDFLDKLTLYTSLKREITEPKKRSLVSELRESLRNFEVNNLNESNTKK